MKHSSTVFSFTKLPSPYTFLIILASASTALAQSPTQISPNFSQFLEYSKEAEDDSQEPDVAPTSSSPRFDLPPIAQLVQVLSGDLSSIPTPPFYTSTLTMDPSSTMSTSISAPQTSSTTLRLGPGPVIPVTWDVSITPDSHTSTTAFSPAPSIIAAPSTHNESTVPAAFDHTPIIIGSVLLGLIMFSLITCVLLNTKRLRRTLFLRGVHRDLDSRVVNDLEKSSPFPVEGKESDTSQPLSPFPAWMKLPSQISAFHSHRDSLLSYLYPARNTLVPQQPRPKNKVIDIVSDFPRSRFSVTSSDYAQSICSVDSNRYLQPAVPRRKSIPLLTPDEFFSLPSSTTIASRHSRKGSAPVFGCYRREAGLSLALSRVRTLEQKITPETKSRINDRAKSMTIIQGRRMPRRTQSVAVVIRNGEWI